MPYSNCTIDQGGFGTYQSDTATAATLTLYQRVKFSTTADTNGAKPTLLVAQAADRGVAVVMQQNVLAGAFTTVRFLNAQGEQFGIIDSAGVAVGTAIYTAASGTYSATQGSGVLIGYSTIAASGYGVFTFLPINAAA